MARAFRIRLRSTTPSKRPHWTCAFFALLFLSSAIEAQPCKAPVCHVVAMACAGPSCGRDSVDPNIPREENVVQMAANYQPPLAYFLDELPGDFDFSKTPNGARELTIAKVRAHDIPVWLGKRDQSGILPPQRSRDKNFVRMQVLEVRSGSASVGKTYEVYFGEWSREMIYPLTPDQLARDYIVAMYSDPTDGKYRLIGFPVSSAQYQDWMTKLSEYWRSQHKK